MTKDALIEISERAPHLYSSFKRPKKDGTFRTITPPIDPLKKTQRHVKEVLQRVLIWPTEVHGGVSGRDIISNALPHVAKRMVANLDIAQFFPSTSPAMVAQALIGAGCPADTAELITRLSTHQGGLPQGSPTSMLLGNLVLEPVDLAFRAIAKNHGLTYSRYVDDVTLSAPRDIRTMRQLFTGVVEDAGFSLAAKKVLFRLDCERQVVTGLVVNNKLFPTNEFVSDLKQLAKRCWPEEDGVEAVADEMGLHPTQLIKTLWGRLQHLKRVNRQRAIRLHGLLDRISRPLRETSSAA